MGYNGGSRILCRALMGVSCAALVLDFQKDLPPRGHVLNLTINLAPPARRRRLFECAKLPQFGTEPDIPVGGLGRLGISRRIPLVGILVVDLTEFLGFALDEPLTRIFLIKICANGICRILFSQCTALIGLQLPVSALCKIVVAHLCANYPIEGVNQFL